jgi:hypothetical protein
VRAAALPMSPHSSLVNRGNVDLNSACIEQNVREYSAECCTSKRYISAPLRVPWLHGKHWLPGPRLFSSPGLSPSRAKPASGRYTRALSKARALSSRARAVPILNYQINQINQIPNAVSEPCHQLSLEGTPQGPLDLPTMQKSGGIRRRHPGILTWIVKYEVYER